MKPNMSLTNPQRRERRRKRTRRVFQKVHQEMSPLHLISVLSLSAFDGNIRRGNIILTTDFLLREPAILRVVKK